MINKEERKKIIKKNDRRKERKRVKGSRQKDINKFFALIRAQLFHFQTFPM